MELRVRGGRWKATAEAILAGVLAVGLFISGSFFPVVGLALSLLCPLPFVAVGLRHGWAMLLLALALATAVLMVPPLSVLQGIAFVLQFGIPAAVLYMGLQRGVRSEIVVIGIAVLLAVGGIAVLGVASGQWGRPMAAFEKELDGVLAWGARVGISDGQNIGENQIRDLRAIVLAAFPGLLFLVTLFTAVGYMVMLQAIMRRWPAQAGSTLTGPFRWELPESLVWVFIAAGLAFLAGVPWLRSLGLNGLIILLGLYFLQGLSIAAFLFQRFQLPRFLATLSVILLVFQPLFALLVAGLGLFDVWFAFRRLSLPRSPRQT